MVEPRRPGTPGELLGDLIRSVGAFVDRLALDEAGSREPPRLDPSTVAGLGGRLTIRPPSPSDRRALERIYRDRDNQAAHGWSDGTVAELVRELRVPRVFEGLTRSALVGVRRDTFDVIGLATLQAHRSHDDRLGLSIGLSTLPEHRGQGLAIELLAAMIIASRALVATADDGEPFPLWVGTSTTNESVQRMMSSLGYQPDGPAVPHTTPAGITLDSYWYDVGHNAAPPRFTPRPSDDPLQ